MREQRVTEGFIGRQLSAIRGSHVERNEAFPLFLGDLQASMCVDETLEATHLAGEDVGATEGLGSECGEVSDVLGSAGAEQRL
jgi:hypothetical protein